jgi:hypothetical protein
MSARARRTGWIALLVALAMLVSTAPSGASSGDVQAVSAAKRTYARFAGPKQFLPATLLFGAHSAVTDLQWSSWGRTLAEGRGNNQFNDCLPSCAEGKITPVPSAVFLTGRIKCGKHFIFKRLKVFPDVPGYPVVNTLGFCPKK